MVLVDVDNPSIRNWKTIIPESDHVIQSVSFVGNSIVVKYLIDVAADIHIYNYNGDRIDTIGGILSLMLGSLFTVTVIG